MLSRGLKEYFNFTKKERIGIISLVCIILIFTLSPFFFHYFVKDEKVDTSQFEKEIALLQIDSSSQKVYSKNYDEYSSAYPKYNSVSNAELFFFDPNKASVNEWMRLGVKEKTAKTIQKYISKGGKFYKAEDIKKIWGLSETDAERLIPYVSIKSDPKNYLQNEQNGHPEKAGYTTHYTIKNIDINTADTTQFIALPGIGNKLAKRIISFRENLGGFYSIDQVAETYLLPDSTFQNIKPYLFINIATLKRININTASVDEMKAHPYIKYNIANLIFQYRQQHGNFNSVKEIKKIMTVTDEFYEKISPYLSVN